MLSEEYYIRLYITIAAALPVFFWIFLYFRYGNKFKENLQAVDKEVFSFSFLFFIGYGVIDFFHINIYSERGQKKMQLLREIMPRETVPFYYYTTLAAQISYAVTILPFALLIAAFAEDYMILFIGILVIVFFVFYMDYSITSKVEERHEELLVDFPHMLSQLALLVNAGMPLRQAMEKISSGKEGRIYQEIQITLSEISNGTSEYEALKHLSERCNLLEVKRFTTTVLQNLQKGSSQLANTLKDMSNQVWLERSNHIKQVGAAASSKLMIPIMIIFIGILLMVIVPIFTSISF